MKTLDTLITEKDLLSFAIKTDDICSLSLLQSLINGYPYLLFTVFSLRPFCLNHILDDIVINDRSAIIEFGSGLSTILIGRLCKKNNLKTTVVSVDHNEGWVNRLTEMLKKEDLDEIVKVVHAPLKEGKFSEDFKWYDYDIIEAQITDKRFDMVIVDGPPAWENGNEEVRYPALPFIKSRLNDRFSVYLDDIDRPGEQAILQRWEKEYAVKFTFAGSTLAYYYKGNSFCTMPF